MKLTTETGKGMPDMFIEKYAERVNAVVRKFFTRSPLLNFIIAFVAVSAEVAAISLLVNSSFADSFFVKIAAPLLWAAVFAECYFAGWIFSAGKPEDDPKQLRVKQWFMFILAVLMFIAYFVSIPAIFEFPDRFN